MTAALSFLIFATMACWAVAFQVGALSNHKGFGQSKTCLSLSSSVAPPAPLILPPHLAAALKKPSKTLTVGMGYATSGTDLTKGELGTLSMQARKLKVSSLWTSEPTAAEEFLKEQASAKGNFPGPCPIVWTGENAEEGIELGVDAVVLPAAADTALDNVNLLLKLTENQVGVVWQVGSQEEVEAVVASQGGTEGKDKVNSICFLVGCDSNVQEGNLDAVLSAIPANAITLASMQAMQDDNGELATGRALKQQGVHGIILNEALVGDAEDVEYCTFAVEGLIKKQSSTFGGMSGLTGSTNGHFGGVSSSVAKTWRRVVYADSQ